MPCDTRLKARQTISQRKEEVRKAVSRLSEKITAGQAKVVVSKTGAVAFAGLTESERDGVTDACAYRLLMVHGSGLAKAAIARAEQIAGVSVNRKLITHGGEHSHDGGQTWDRGH